MRQHSERNIRFCPAQGFRYLQKHVRVSRGIKPSGGGLRIYFGAEKSLIRRHREDDPRSRLPDDLFALGNGRKNTNLPVNAPPVCIEGIFVPGEGCVFTSDRRLKRDLVALGTLDNGLALYRFRYTWSDIVYVGVMAQDVLLVQPDAVVTGADGFYRVDYAALGLRMMTYAEWQRWPQWLMVDHELAMAA